VERIALAKAHLALDQPKIVDGLLAPLLGPDLPFLTLSV
jgi:hypothetical protein